MPQHRRPTQSGLQRIFAHAYRGNQLQAVAMTAVFWSSLTTAIRSSRTVSGTVMSRIDRQSNTQQVLIGHETRDRCCWLQCSFRCTYSSVAVPTIKWLSCGRSRFDDWRWRCRKAFWPLEMMPAPARHWYFGFTTWLRAAWWADPFRASCTQPWHRMICYQWPGISCGSSEQSILLPPNFCLHSIKMCLEWVFVKMEIMIKGLRVTI